MGGIKLNKKKRVGGIKVHYKVHLLIIRTIQNFTPIPTLEYHQIFIAIETSPTTINETIYDMYGECPPMRILHIVNMQSSSLSLRRYISIFGRRADEKVSL